MHTTLTTLFSASGAVLNRDRAGQPKSLPDGRQYISSQAWRAAMRDQQIAPLSKIETTGTVRSRAALTRALVADGHGEEEAKAIQKTVLDMKGNDVAPQVLGKAEIAAIVDAMRGTDASEPDVKKRSKTLAPALLPHHAGIEAMLFGRMVTGDALRRIDGILSTSAAIATEPVPTVQDFFIARDQLVDVGTAHMGTKPLSTGVFLQTTVIDEGRMGVIGEAVAPEDLVEWVVRAVAYAPTKLSRAGSAPLPPATEVWVIRSSMPYAVEVGGDNLSAARDRVEEELEQRSRLYGEVSTRRLSDAGLDALVDAVRADRTG